MSRCHLLSPFDGLPCQRAGEHCAYDLNPRLSELGGREVTGNQELVVPDCLVGSRVPLLWIHRTIFLAAPPTLRRRR